MIREKDIRNKYNTMEYIWDKSDSWHLHTKNSIDSCLNNLIISSRTNLDEGKILFAGSAGNEHSLGAKHAYHLDIAERHLKGVQNSVVGGVQNSPFTNNTFDLIICVGSVINYVDAMTSIKELSRVLKSNGTLIVEFESSRNLEFLFTKSFNKSAYITSTFYQGMSEQIWVYSEKYIKSIAKACGLKVVSTRYFHIGTAIAYFFTRSERISSKLSFLDSFLSKRTNIRKLSSNIMICFSKS